MSGVNYAEYYETEQALHAVSGWYTDDKEQAFLDFILREARIPSDGTILEIGGGGAVHGRILARRFGARTFLGRIEPACRKCQENGVAGPSNGRT